MELRIQDDKGLVDTSFGNWLIIRIQAKLISNISKYKGLVSWDKYLNESTTIDRLYDIEYHTSDIVIFAAKNLVCDGTDGEIVIHFDFNKFVPGFNRLKLDTLIRTINYGTRDIKACPIFTESFNYFANDIGTYVRQYYML